MVLGTTTTEKMKKPPKKRNLKGEKVYAAYRISAEKREAHRNGKRYDEMMASPREIAKQLKEKKQNTENASRTDAYGARATTTRNKEGEQGKRQEESSRPTRCWRL